MAKSKDPRRKKREAPLTVEFVRTHPDGDHLWGVEFVRTHPDTDQEETIFKVSVVAPTPEATRFFGIAAQIIDLVLEPEAAESAIVNLSELYVRRHRMSSGHAKRWLIAQLGWIVFGRAMDV